jgi:lipopolysaccharide export system permease protein
LIITRYITREVLQNAFVVAVVLLLLISSSRFAKYLAQAATGELELSVAFTILLNLMLGYLGMILPLAAFLGTLLAFGRLYIDSEVIVLVSSGVSQRQLLQIALVPLSIIAILVGLLTLVWAPEASRKVEQMLYEQRYLTTFENIIPGQFQGHDQTHQVIYAEQLSDDRRTLYNVFIFQRADDNVSELVIKAASGRQYYDDNLQARYLLLQDGTRIEGKVSTLDYHITQFKQMGLLVKQPQLTINITQADTLPTLYLWGSSLPVHKAQLYWRVSLPLMTLIISLVAIAMSQVNSRQGRYARLVPAIIIYLVYLAMLIQLRGEIEQGNTAGNWLMLLVHVMMLCIGLNSLFASHHWRRWLNQLKKMLRKKHDATT